MGRRANLRGVFENEATQDKDSFLTELDAATYGKLGAIDNSRIVAEGYLLSELQPDPQQPRRVLPSAVRRMVDIYNMPATMERWHHTAEREMGRSIPLRDLVEGKVEDGQFDTEGIDYDHYPVAASFLGVTQLAGEILRDGLTNPISIHRHGREFMINKGERRWFAFHILYGLYGSRYIRIPAREESPSVWSQASENMSREDLGGVALARQFALLLMSFYPEQPWGQVGDFITDEGCDRLFYAQVQDGEEWRIPKNKGQQIASAMQASATSLRAYRQILGVPDAIWLEADDKHWSTHRLREWIVADNKEKNPPAPKPFERKVPLPAPAENNHTVAAATVSGEDDGYHPLNNDQRKQVSIEPDLPPGYTLADINTGERANVAIPQDEVTARIQRYGSVIVPSEEIDGALERLSQVQSLTILRGEETEKRLSLMFRLGDVASHALRLAGQLVDTFEKAPSQLLFDLYAEIGEAHKPLFKAIRKQSGFAVGDAEELRNGVEGLLNSFNMSAEAHITERMALVIALADVINQELQAIHEISESLQVEHLIEVKKHLALVDTVFEAIANNLNARLGG